MQRNDKRRQARYRLAHQPAAPVVVLRDEVRLTASAVNDVSSSGISLCLDTALPVEAAVAIEYQLDGLTLDVNGVVAWCRKHTANDAAGSDTGYVLGIELFSPMMLLSAFRDALPKDAQTFEEA
jgi:hypothetical protein